MLVKYRMLAGATIADLKSDIHKIISGQITAVADFSASCDKTNTAIYGSYPTGKYAVQDAASYTYSKVHSQDASYTEYFRLIWGAAQLDQIVLAAGYTAGTNTLVNSTTSSVYRYAWETTYTGLSQRGGESAGVTTFNTNGQIDSAKWMFIGNGTQFTTTVGDSVRMAGEYHRYSDTGTNIYRVGRFERNTIVTSLLSTSGTGASTYTYATVNWDSMVPTAFSIGPSPSSGVLQGWRAGNINVTTASYTAPTYNTLDIVINSKGIFFGSTVNNVAFGIFDISKNGISREFTNSALMAMVDLNNVNNGVQIPYFYNVQTSTYGVVSGGSINYDSPVRIPRANANMTIVENPISTSYRAGGFSTSAIYGVYRIADNTYNNGSRYTDGSGVSRVVYNNFAIVTE